VVYPTGPRFLKLVDCKVTSKEEHAESQGYYQASSYVVGYGLRLTFLTFPFLKKTTSKPPGVAGE
jgi:hypothetical protein